MEAGNTAGPSGCACNGSGGGSSGGNVPTSTAGETLTAPSAITLFVHPTTGGQFELQVPSSESIESLKKMISKRLKVPKERICLLYRERHLRDGTLHQNNLMDGCKITLLPSVETGLLAQRPEQSVMQALESLSDAQVNDFLSGKAPLNLTMRLGDHMMFIQLQLSTVAPNTARKHPATTLVSLPAPPSVSTAAVEELVPPPSPLAADTCQSSRPVAEIKPVLDTKALAEASRNLTQTLRQLSTQALSSRIEDTEKRTIRCLDSHALRRRQGAIIESMHHHGRGVYSGTFSGTLNPALQDKHGRPKRDISTIIHILNDLLGATPQYRRVGRVMDGTQLKPSAQRALPSKSQEEFNRLNQENKATRGKMEQIQMMLEERRARRRARREARAPYTWSANSKASVKAEAVECDSHEAMETNAVSDNGATEYHELNTETVVA